MKGCTDLVCGGRCVCEMLCSVWQCLLPHTACLCVPLGSPEADYMFGFTFMNT